MAEEQKSEELKPIAVLKTEYDGDESFLINSSTGTYLGGQGDHRLLTLNMDSNTICIYEATSGTDRYPPGRMMVVKMTYEEFATAANIVFGRAERQAEKLKKEKELQEAVKASSGDKASSDDFDPFLDVFP